MSIIVTGIRQILKRIVGVTIGGFGVQWTPQNESAESPEAVDDAYFSPGDWITAAIVAPEHSANVLKRIAISTSFRKNASRKKRIEIIAAEIDTAIKTAMNRYRQRGASDEDKCEAAIAKICADLLDKQQTEFLWIMNQQAEADPMQTLKELTSAMQ